MSEVEDGYDVMLQTRVKPVNDSDQPVKIWSSTYSALIGIKAKMELSSREITSIPQVIDALARSVERTKIQVESDD